MQLRAWERNPIANLETVTPEYFDAIGTHVIKGRAFADTDVLRAPRVAVVSEGLARRLWPGQDPIGRRILPPGQPGDGTTPPWATVIGVVRDGRYRGITDPRFDLYLSYLQVVEMPVKHLMVRASGDAVALVAAIRQATRRLEPTALVERAAPMSDFVDRATAPWRFSASTLGLLGLVALTLAALGVYAAINQSVVERAREIGVRVAVGANPREIVTLVAREGLGLTILGIAIGLGVATAAGRVLAGLLFEVSPIDPLTLTTMSGIFIVTSIAALVIPARRAARVDPASVLRRP
jgi:putative ABC transport system permease protein